ncbi:aminoglycoside phosphotransferase [Cohnella endophytica]|uniref:Aminoglycoside phosphotransferase n=1 Tax=Cohnella endophytica TaxID=2419778 RepID=A0A494XU99_9BACL|nr:phosphotransferase [Cohnella endophytica]RKP54148.1 aminoglycoside phosphotransferase [Cohnella endophytica]
MWDELLARYIPGRSWHVSEGETGWNNTTRFVEMEGRRWVLRVYDAHRDAAKIRFEHAALIEVARRQLPFRTPIPVLSTDGTTYVKLPDGSGKYACLFYYIEGVRPTSMSVVADTGRQTGRLMQVLNDVVMNESPAYFPSYELEAAHPACSPERVQAFCNRPPEGFEHLREGLRVLYEAWETCLRTTPALRALPHQLIHGDINPSNILVLPERPDRVAAFLDFEICTRDVRAMEPAVLLSGLISIDASIDDMEALLGGMRETARLSSDEAEAVPLLMRLHKLDLFVHYLGRYLEGVDSPDVVREQIESNAAGLLKLNELAPKLKALCVRMLT